MQEVHSSFSFISVPKIFLHLSRKRVLTMEWIVGESPTDLVSISTENSTGKVSEYSERQKVDAKRRLLDLVCKKKCIFKFSLYIVVQYYFGCLIISRLLDYDRSKLDY